MADTFSKEKRSEIMSKIRSKNTKPELILRKELWRKKHRYRIHYGKEKIDIAFPSIKLAIFVDGCFWHGCRRHYRKPKSNKKYWTEKIEKNKKRAKRKDMRLRGMGWKSVHVWEHELKNVDKIVNKISKIIANKNGKKI